MSIWYISYDKTHICGLQKHYIPSPSKVTKNFITDWGEPAATNRIKSDLLCSIESCCSSLRTFEWPEVEKKNPPLHILFREVNIQDSFILNFGVCRCTQTHSLKKILQELLLTVTCIKANRYTHGQRAAVHPTFALRSLCLNYIIPQSTTVSQWVPI